MVAFGFVGMIFDAVGAYDFDLMSDCHWIICFIHCDYGIHKMDI